MEWHERMNTEIKVGNNYLNRNRDIIIVEKKLTDNDYEVKKNDLKDNYIVNKFGGFGNYPNNKDLVSLI